MSTNRTMESRYADEDIAIVGMACLFPGAETLEQYWHNIVHKVDRVTDPPADWQPDLFLDPTGRIPDRVYTGRGGYLGDLCRFDAKRYGVMPNSVEGSEPDQFIALRLAFEALQDAGVPDVPLNHERTGVILGRGTYVNRGYTTMFFHGFVVDQMVNVLQQAYPDLTEEDLAAIRADVKKRIPPLCAETVPGLCHSVMVGRIANRLDFKGPCLTVDAACASSLLAVDAAMRELRAGRCDACLAGGVQVSTPGVIDLMFCHLGALSRSGRIAPFSAEANGTLLGEGAGIVVLKRRSDAERDGNRIYALLKSVGVSSDGRSGGLLAPDKDGQVLAVRQAYEERGVDPSTVGLIEAHGTGIPLGDRTEIESLCEVFGGRPETGPRVAIGSVKSQISHLIPAAGVASLIKTALALYHRVLPPTLHAEQVNPDLGLDRTPFYVNTETRPWVHGDRQVPRRAAVDAFGFGGINAHAVLEEHTNADERTLVNYDRVWPTELVVVSADSREALQARTAALADWVEAAKGVELVDVAAACATEPGAVRVALCVKDLGELAQKLRHVTKCLADPKRTRIQDRSGIFYYDEPLGRTGKLAFVFPGEGAQYVGMLADLCRAFPEVRRQFDLTDHALLSHGARRTLSGLVYPAPEETERAEKALFEMEWAVQAVTTAGRAFTTLLDSIGLRADGIVGHSSGEFAALVAAGAVDITDEDDLVDAVIRGGECTARIVDPSMTPRATLATVGGCAFEDVEQVVAASHGQIAIALDNCPHQVVLAGSDAAMTEALEQLRKKGGLCEVLPWDRAYHTKAFAPACEALKEYHRTLRFVAPKVETWSCASAGRYPTEPREVEALAISQWCMTVRFRETIQNMYDAGYRLFVEVGPRGNLTAFIGDTLHGRDHAAVPLDLMRRGSLVQLCRALGQLAAHGVSFDLGALYRRRTPRPVDLKAAPPRAPERAPVLRLDLPELALSDEVKQAIQRRLAAKRPPAPASTPAPAPASAAPVQPISASAPAPAAPASPTGPSGNGQAGHGFGNGREAAFAEFQKTMRLFLETQEQAMKRMLNGHASPAAAPITPIAVSAPPAAPAPVAAAPPARAPEPVAASAVVEERQLAAPAAQATAPAAVPVPESSAPSSDALQEALLNIVSERTGYPTDMLELGANLEADLGIDSIKRVEIIAAFRRKAAPEVQEPPAWFVEEMTDAKSLETILAGVTRLVESASGAVAVPRREEQRGSGPETHGNNGNNGHGVQGVGEGQRPFVHPLISREVTREPGRLVVECELSSRGHRFLRHHTFGRAMSAHDPTLRGMAVMPLAMTVELLAAGALALFPQMRVARVRDMRTLGWLAFDTETRRVRIEARDAGDGVVEVEAYRADRDTQSPYATARVELASRAVEPGPATVHAAPDGPSTWRPQDLYTEGLFHGPSFQVVKSMDGSGPDAVTATLVEPADEPLLDEDADRLILPVALIDGVGQVLGFWRAEEDLAVCFPTGVGCLEYASERPVGVPLKAAGRIRPKDGRRWDSDVELTAPDGRVVLRMSGRVDQDVDLPRHFWEYRVNPFRLVFSRAMTEVFAGVPGIERCTVTELNDFGGPILIEAGGIWSLDLARSILNHEEQDAYFALKRPPAARASWLLGRTVVKDAVRIHRDLWVGMSDVAVESDGRGAPRVRLVEGASPRVSFAHAGYRAAAVAADAEAFRGVGIDIEPLRPMDAGVVEDAFTSDERQRLEEAVPAEERDALLLSAWCAKEAVAKALGLGLLGSPRHVEIVDGDPDTGRLRARVTGALADELAAQGVSDPQGLRLEAHRRIRSGSVVALCLWAGADGGDERSGGLPPTE